MDIVLSQKDADWIANIVREKIAGLEESFKNAREKGDRIYDLCKKIAEDAGIDPEHDNEGDSLLQIKEKSEKELYDDYNHWKSIYEKILLLMMVGSY